MPSTCAVGTPSWAAYRQLIVRRAGVPYRTAIYPWLQQAQAPYFRASSTVQTNAKGGKGKKKEENIYSPTVNLPITEFNIRGMAKIKEPEIQAFWESNEIYKKLLEENGGPVFTLHDGPPYANGDLHIGHALNKILKDIINKRKLLEGYKAKFIPGWDTHGLPIELKVLQTISDEERMQLTPLQLRQKAKQFALSAVDAQLKQFKRFGVWADWENPYVTLQSQYEAAQIRVFGQMVLKGHIYRGRKPVNWSPSSMTALAEAELEYPPGHKSKSVYVTMPVSSPPAECSQELAEAMHGAALAIWTTTPWTIPANVAVAVNEELTYAVVELPPDVCEWLTCRRIIVARDLVPAVAAKLKTDADALSVVATASGAELSGATYSHPLCDRSGAVVIGGDYITTEAGTGLVHTAPGHGEEDFEVGQKYGLPILCPVDAAGVFTSEAGEKFQGLPVQSEGNAAVIAALKNAGVLLRAEDYKHKYPYDWRTKKPTIVRVTDQWFASVDAFKDDVMSEISNVKWQPATGQNRISAMVLSRSDWCISRQRTWGVPIPVFYYRDSGQPLLTEESIAHVEQVFAEHGSDAWWKLPVADLLPDSLKGDADLLDRGTDTMDVWFDSGSSWAAVCQQQEGLTYPADLYLEGSDQHRGWFQSSILTSVAVAGQAPYKHVLTHGFVLDEKGLKMSKSTGNVVDPATVIEGTANAKKHPAYGADVLRLWAASVDYSVDVTMGDSILKQVFESYRKIRGTLRFLLGNLHDFDPSSHAVDPAALPAVDQYMAARLDAFNGEIASHYADYNFAAAYRAINSFVSVELSSMYFELAKDRLYIRALDSPQRRSCQTILRSILSSLLSCLAPVTSHMCEDAWQHVPHVRDRPSSVFQQGVPSAGAAPAAPGAMEAVRDAIAVKDVVLKALELAREAKDIGAPLDAHVTLAIADADARARLSQLNSAGNGVDELKYMFIVSGVSIVQKLDGEALHTAEMTIPEVGVVSAAVNKAPGRRCERCWHYCESVGDDPDHPDVCSRCMEVVDALGFTLPAAAVTQQVAV